MKRAELDCVLFDLDGTLIDTAPDMAGACNALRSEFGLPEVDPAIIRPHVSRGAAGVLAVGMPSPEEDSEYERWQLRFLELYRSCLSVSSQLFPGMASVLDAIESSGRCWGVVTNKAGWLAQPLLDDLELSGRACSIVAGDTLAERKPHPAPLLHAAGLCDVAPENCIYVGDDVRDIIASRAAGMPSAAALWGYIPPDEAPERWGAGRLLEAPQELLPLVRRRR